MDVDIKDEYINGSAGFKPHSEVTAPCNVYEESTDDTGSPSNHHDDAHTSQQRRSVTIDKSEDKPKSISSRGFCQLTWTRVIVGNSFVFLVVAFALTTTFLVLHRNAQSSDTSATTPLSSYEATTITQPENKDTPAATDAPPKRKTGNTTTSTPSAICTPRNYGGFFSCSSNVSHQVEVHMLAIYEPLGSMRIFRDPPTDVKDVKVMMNTKPGCGRPSSIKLMLTSYEAAHWKIQAPTGVTIDEIVLGSYYIDYSSASVMDSTHTPHMVILPGDVYYGYGETEDRYPDIPGFPDSYTPNKDEWETLKRFLLDHFGYLSSFAGTYNPAELNITIGSCN